MKRATEESYRFSMEDEGVREAQEEKTRETRGMPERERSVFANKIVKALLFLGASLGAGIGYGASELSHRDQSNHSSIKRAEPVRVAPPSAQEHAENNRISETKKHLHDLADKFIDAHEPREVRAFTDLLEDLTSSDASVNLLDQTPRHDEPLEKRDGFQLAPFILNNQDVPPPQEDSGDDSASTI